MNEHGPTSAPLVSVVVAVKDNPDGLRATLCSLQRQRTSAPEIIVIDGGSAPPTQAVIDAFSSIIAYSESGMDSGIADAFNRGIVRASGTYVAILNSGDTWADDTLDVLQAAATDADYPDVLHGHVRFVSLAGDSRTVRTDYRRHHRRAHIFHPSMFVRRNCYQAVGPYDTRYRLAMDSEWTHRAMAAGARFVEVDAVLANMELGGVSDVHYVAALREFRNSVVTHGLASRLSAGFHFCLVVAGKFLRNGSTRLARRLRRARR